MEPMSLLAGGSALAGLLGAARGGGSKTTQNTQTTVSNPINIVTPTTQTFGLSLTNNPTIANMIGAGSTVAPASGGSYLPQSVSPNVNAPLDNTTSPNQSATDGASGGVLPRSSPLGNVGLGAGFATARPVGTAQNDLLLILLLAGGAALLLWQQE